MYKEDNADISNKSLQKTCSLLEYEIEVFSRANHLIHYPIEECLAQKRASVFVSGKWNYKENLGRTRFKLKQLKNLCKLCIF